MKTRGKILLFALLSLWACANVVNAQEWKFGIKGGLNVSTITGLNDLMETAEMGSFSTSSKASCHLGVVAQCDFGGFFIQPELLYSSLGVKGNLSGESDALALDYIQLPVYAGYKFPIGESAKFLLAAGPYLACGVVGDFDIEGENFFKRFDAGIGIMAGVEVTKNAQISVGYDFGLLDIVNINGWKTAKDLYGLSTIANRNLKVSFAYFF